MLAVTAAWLRFGQPEGLFGDDELAYGIHGGDVETSLMLHYQPEAVRRDKLADFVSAARSVGSATPNGSRCMARRGRAGCRMISIQRGGGQCAAGERRKRRGQRGACADRLCAIGGRRRPLRFGPARSNAMTQDLARIRAFVQVFDAGGFSAAARQHGRSKALLSQICHRSRGLSRGAADEPDDPQAEPDRGGRGLLPRSRARCCSSSTIWMPPSPTRPRSRAGCCGFRRRAISARTRWPRQFLPTWPSSPR